MKLADRLLEIQASVTMAFDKKAKEMKKKFPETIILAAGEPDFLPPEAAIQATSMAGRTGKTKYTPVEGNFALLEAISKLHQRKQGLLYSPAEQILCTNGGKEAIYLALLAIVNPGDEVLIISPYWTSYPEMVKLCGGEPHIFDVKDLPKLNRILDNSNIKAIIFNSPCNPTGKVFSSDELKIIFAALKDRNIWVISDEIYSAITFGSNNHVSLAKFKELTDKTVVIDGVSKAYAMTGYRLGYALGAAVIIKEMKKLKSQISSCPCSISQEAALAAISEGDKDVENMRLAYERRANAIILPFARKMQLKYFEPEGAFYWFFKIPGKKPDCMKFCLQLLEEEKLGLVPGIAFGYPGWARLSFAASDQDLEEGLTRLERKLKK